MCPLRLPIAEIVLVTTAGWGCGQAWTLRRPPDAGARLPTVRRRGSRTHRAAPRLKPTRPVPPDPPRPIACARARSAGHPIRRRPPTRTRADIWRARVARDQKRQSAAPCLPPRAKRDRQASRRALPLSRHVLRVCHVPYGGGEALAGSSRVRSSQESTLVMAARTAAARRAACHAQEALYARGLSSQAGSSVITRRLPVFVHVDVHPFLWQGPFERPGGSHEDRAPTLLPAEERPVLRHAPCQGGPPYQRLAQPSGIVAGGHGVGCRQWLGVAWGQ